MMFDGKYLKSLDNNDDLFYDVGAVVYYTGAWQKLQGIPGIVLKMKVHMQGDEFSLVYTVMFGDSQEQCRSDQLSGVQDSIITDDM